MEPGDSLQQETAPWPDFIPGSIMQLYLFPTCRLLGDFNPPSLDNASLGERMQMQVSPSRVYVQIRSTLYGSQAHWLWLTLLRNM